MMLAVPFSNPITGADVEFHAVGAFAKVLAHVLNRVTNAPMHSEPSCDTYMTECTVYAAEVHCRSSW